MPAARHSASAGGMRHRAASRSCFWPAGYRSRRGKNRRSYRRPMGRARRLVAAYLSRGRPAYVRATGLSGDNPSAGSRYLITDTGARFAIHDDDAAHDLGLPDTAIAAPWPVLAKLPAGPELSRQNALIAS